MRDLFVAGARRLDPIKLALQFLEFRVQFCDVVLNIFTERRICFAQIAYLIGDRRFGTFNGFLGRLVFRFKFVSGDHIVYTADEQIVIIFAFLFAQVGKLLDEIFVHQNAVNGFEGTFLLPVPRTDVFETRLTVGETVRFRNDIQPLAANRAVHKTGQKRVRFTVRSVVSFGDLFEKILRCDPLI